MKYLAKELYKFIFQFGLSLLDFFPDSFLGNRLRGAFVSIFVNGHGKRLQVCKKVHILYPHKLRVGNDVFIGYGNWLNAMGGIEFDDQVITGPHVKISTGDHIIQSGSFRFGDHNAGPVRVGFGAWLAAGVIVMKNVSIGRSALVAAGAVVTRNLDAYGKYGGIPAQLLGKKS